MESRPTRSAHDELVRSVQGSLAFGALGESFGVSRFGLPTGLRLTFCSRGLAQGPRVGVGAQGHR